MISKFVLLLFCSCWQAAYPTLSDVAAAVIPAEVQVVTTAGHTTVADGGAATYKRVVAQPAHSLHTQSADGAWWELHTTTTLSPEQGGGFADGSDISSVMQAVAAQSAAWGVKAVGTGGKVYVCTDIDIPYGFHWDGRGCTLRQPDNSPNFHRLFTTIDLPDGPLTEDPRAIVIENTTFDGNRLNQGAYTGGELEHNHAIFATAATTGGFSVFDEYHLHLHVRNCHFKDWVGDGVAIWKNVVATIDSCHFTDNWRADISMTGGHGQTTVTNYHGHSHSQNHPNHIDHEVDSGGFNGSFVHHMTVENASTDGSAGFQIDYSADTGTRITMRDVFGVTDPNWIGRTATSIPVVNMTNVHCDISGAKTIWIRRPGISKYKSCVFKASGTGSCVHQHVETAGHRVVYEDCRFEGDGTTDTGLYLNPYAASGEPVDASSTTVVNCEFSGCTRAVYNDRSGKLVVKDLDPSQIQTTVFARLWHQAGVRPASLRLFNVHLGNSVSTFFDMVAQGSGSIVEFENVTLAASANNNTGAVGTPTTETVLGTGRRIYGTSPSGAAWVGDRFLHTAPTTSGYHEWVAITAANVTPTWKGVVAIAP